MTPVIRRHQTVTVHFVHAGVDVIGQFQVVETNEPWLRLAPTADATVPGPDTMVDLVVGMNRARATVQRSDADSFTILRPADVHNDPTQLADDA